ncbi:hypothetical protein [Mucilaginibacter kameinonensis]|uniref:hypothetical protein n=1 Tax=Mucilaginibacter kameinonensis TaxID=452286 RepID=UPI000EF83193|nr:hypothetical protein [Mucilaginibacter kameinonensis]
MAKKNFGNIEENQKNLTGANALFSPPSDDAKTAKRKTEAETEEGEEITAYPLRMKKDWLKALKIMSANRGESVKNLILQAIADKYKLS